MSVFRRTPRRLDLENSSLAPTEAFVLSRLGGGGSLAQLCDLTGLDEGRVSAAVTALMSAGLVSRDGALEITASASLLPKAVVASAPPRYLDSVAADATPAPTLSAAPAAELAADDDWAVALPDAEPASAEMLDAEDAGADAADPDAGADIAATHRQRYAQVFAKLTRDERVSAAQNASRENAAALAYDPDPQVIRALCEHFTDGLEPLRLVAAHHNTPQGLDALLKRPDALRDGLVERRLLRNLHVSESMLRRLLANKRLLKLFQVVGDRDLPELTRVRSRGVLRAQWPLSTPEERAELLTITEGRCLPQLVGLTFDQRLINLLCARPVHSPVFVQSLARFSATPPPVLAHLMRQPIVKRSAHLRMQVQQHPNTPAEAKRM